MLTEVFLFTVLTDYCAYRLQITDYSAYRLLCLLLFTVLKPQSHIHDARPARQKFIHFFQCVALRYAFVTRSSSALGQRYRASSFVACVDNFCACSKMCVELDARRRTPDTRRARWTSARYPRNARRVFVVCSPADASRTPSADLTCF